MTGPVETEFKLRASTAIEVAALDAALREAGVTGEDARRARHEDTYLDDAARSLAAAGIGLRVRAAADGARIACKTRGRRRGALFVRAEREADWPARVPPRAAAELPAALRELVEPVLGQRPLLPLLRLGVVRDLRRVARAGRLLGELALDHVTAHGGGRRAAFTEVELEVAADLAACRELVGRLEPRLGLAAAPDDKPTHAAELLGLPPGGRPVGPDGE